MEKNHLQPLQSTDNRTQGQEGAHLGEAMSAWTLNAERSKDAMKLGCGTLSQLDGPDQHYEGVILQALWRNFAHFNLVPEDQQSLRRPRVCSP